MAKTTLIMALDFKKRKGDKSGRYSYRRGSDWYLVKYGPGFSNTFKVTEYSAAELAVLESIEDKGESR